MGSPYLLRQFIATMLITASFTANAAESFDDSIVARFQYPDWFKTTFYDLRDDLADARDTGKQGILLFFSTAGCSYCKQMLDGSFADPAFADRLRERFDVIGLEIFSDEEITDWKREQRSLSAFAYAQGAQFSPTLIFYDTGGRQLLRLVGYYDVAHLGSALDYLGSGQALAMSFREWLDARRVANGSASLGSVGLVADPLFGSPPYQLDRSHHAAEQPLLVLFESADCPSCARFHREVISDRDIRSTLKTFEVVRLDAADDSEELVAPDGGVVTAAEWHRALGFSSLPALAVFDQQGGQILGSDALVLRGRFGNLLKYVQDRAYAVSVRPLHPVQSELDVLEA